MEIRPRTMMKIRPHRGTLDHAMEDEREIPATKEAIHEYINDIHKTLPFSEQELATVSVALYDASPDTRIKWPSTYIICYVPRDSEQRAVFGFCSQYVTMQ